jgi:hypothetical protein
MSPSDKQQLKPAASAAADASRKPARRRGWRIFFSVFKWCRVALLLAVLSLVVLGLFLNRVGLPEWVKQRIVAQMRALGRDGIQPDAPALVSRHRRRRPATPAPTACRATPLLETAEFRLNSRALRAFPPARIR